MTTLAKYTYLGLGTVVQVDYAEPDVRYDLVTGGSSTNPYGGLDRFGRVTDLLWQKYSGTPTDLVRLGYGYDRVSNRTHREDHVAPSGFDELYAYDGIHRLKDFDRGDLNANKDAITSPTLEQSWGLDTTGNWSTFEQNVPGTSSQDLTQSRTHNKVNEITGISETVGASWVTPQHDRNGNMTFMPQPKQPTEGFTATYDAWNRLVKLEEDVEPGSSSSSSSSSESSSSSSSSSESGSSSSSSSESGSSSSSSSQQPLLVTYAYDGQNWRTEKDVNGETTQSFYSRGWQCLEEREGTSTDAHNQYVWGLRYIDDLVIRDRDTTGNGLLDERLYALQDGNWNVAAIIDVSATIVERYAYAAYGRPDVFASTFALRSATMFGWELLYGTYRHDWKVDFYYVRHRYLHSLLGRWVSRDPFFKSTNLYAYVWAQPASRLDPSGLIETDLLPGGPTQFNPFPRAANPRGAPALENGGLRGGLVTASQEVPCHRDCDPRQPHCTFTFSLFAQQFGRDRPLMPGARITLEMRPGFLPALMFPPAAGGKDAPLIEKLRCCQSDIERASSRLGNFTITLLSGTECRFDEAAFDPTNFGTESVWARMPLECRGVLQTQPIVRPPATQGLIYITTRPVASIDADFGVRIFCGCELGGRRDLVIVHGERKGEVAQGTFRTANMDVLSLRGSV